MKAFYESDGIEIYHGDCREVLRQLPLLEIDHIITDPPYSARTHDGARSSTQGNGITWTRKTVAFKPMELTELRTLFGIPCKRWLISFLDYQYAAQLEKEPPEGFKAIRTAIWVKPNPTPQFTGDRPGQGWEAIGIFHNAANRCVWNGGGISGVFTENKVLEDHPTAKPLPLMLKLIQLFTDPDDLILDPFMGSGTTLRAAKDLGRRAIGIEIDEKFCELAARRMNQMVFSFPKQIMAG